MENIINDTFIEFLIKAKKSTYANSTIEKAKSSRVGSSDYHYEEWGMNYYRVTFEDTLGEEAMDNALRPSLMKVGEDKSVIPVRGISHYKNNEYVYTFKTTGTIENFDGIEQIYKDNKLIYELHCSGGLIK